MSLINAITSVLVVATITLNSAYASEPLETDYADPAIYNILAEYQHCSPEYLSALIQNIKPIEYDSQKHDPHKLPLPYGLFMDCGQASLPYLVAVIPTLKLKPYAQAAALYAALWLLTRDPYSEFDLGHSETPAFYPQYADMRQKQIDYLNEWWQSYAEVVTYHLSKQKNKQPSCLTSNSKYGR